MGIISGILGIVGDVIEHIGSGESRDDLHERIRKAADRGAELSLENARLREKVDELWFNGPTLWKDEVDLLKEYALVLKTSLAFNNDAVESREERERDMQIITSLLERCDHWPMTRQELSEQRRRALEDGMSPVDWDDPGRDVSDDPCPECHGSPRPKMGSDKCEVCGNVGRELSGNSW